MDSKRHDGLVERLRLRMAGSENNQMLVDRELIAEAADTLELLVKTYGTLLRTTAKLSTVSETPRIETSPEDMAASLRYLHLSTAPDGQWADQAVHSFVGAMLNDAAVFAPSATPCREDGNHRFEVLLNGRLYLRTHTIDEADILCRAILDGEMGLPSIYDHLRKAEVMLEQ